MKRIPLTQGQFAVVDDADYAEVVKTKWCALKTRVKGKFYAHRKFKGRLQRLHQFILPGVAQIDHIDGDGLNNRRNNLRPASKAENNRNRNKQSGTTSRFKGVYWHKASNKWLAQIKHWKQIYLGVFSSEAAAARAYDIAAIKLFGEFASPNFKQKPKTKQKEKSK